MDGKKGKRSRMNDAGNSGDPPDELPEVDLVEEQPDDHGADNGNGQPNNITHTNKVFAGCIPAGVDEVEDLIIALGEAGRVRADRMRGGDAEYLTNLPAADFDLCRLLEEWGAGRYRIIGRVDGERRASWKRIVTVAAKPGTQARAVDGIPGSSDPRTAPPPPHYPWPMPQYPAQYPPPPVQVVSAPPVDHTAMNTMFQLMIGQAKQQSDLLIALLSQKVEQTNKPAISSEIGELLKVMKDLKGFVRGRGGDDDDDEDGFTTALGKIGATFVRELEQREQQRALVPAPAAAAPGQEAGTSHQVHHPPRPTGTPAVADGARAAHPPSQTRARRPTPAPAANSVEKRIKRAAKLIIITADDPERDPAAFADVMTSILGVDLVEQAMTSMQPGQLSAWMIEQIPELVPSAAFLAEVERELREQMSDPNSADAPADDPPAAGASQPIEE